jgi:LPXTG-motif cell wall-anchored protein
MRQGVARHIANLRNPDIGGRHESAVVTVVQRQVKLTGAMPPPPPPPAPTQPILVAILILPPAPATEAAPAPAELPKTGSVLPLVALLGFLSLVASIGIRTVRSTH